MQPIVLGALPDGILGWRGTASALADQCNALLPTVGMAEEAGCANERLVRHYVQVGILSPPEKEGREAIFGHTHVSQFLAARYLLRDGWTLTKIAELFRAAGPEHLTAPVPEEAAAAPTAAEQALDRLRERAAPPPRPDHDRSVAPGRNAAMFTSPPPPADDRTFLAAPLKTAAEISMRRMGLRTRLMELGNRSGEPERRHTVEIRLTPWCQVTLDAAALQGLTPTQLSILGDALVHALHQEKMTRGTKP